MSSGALVRLEIPGSHSEAGRIWWFHRSGCSSRQISARALGCEVGGLVGRTLWCTTMLSIMISSGVPSSVH